MFSALRPVEIGSCAQLLLNTIPSLLRAQWIADLSTVGANRSPLCDIQRTAIMGAG